MTKPMMAPRALVEKSADADLLREIIGFAADTLAVGVNTDGRREVLGMAVGASEAEPFWTEFLRASSDAACQA